MARAKTRSSKKHPLSMEMLQRRYAARHELSKELELLRLLYSYYDTIPKAEHTATERRVREKRLDWRKRAMRISRTKVEKLLKKWVEMHGG